MAFLCAQEQKECTHSTTHSYILHTLFIECLYMHTRRQKPHQWEGGSGSLGGSFPTRGRLRRKGALGRRNAGPSHPTAPRGCAQREKQEKLPQSS